MSPSAATYLTLALRELDVCAIPGVGTFRKVSSPARPDGDGQLLPPAQSLSFATGIAPSDPTLTSYLISHHHLSETEASRIGSEINLHIAWQLDIKKRYEIQDLGMLMRSGEGTTVFVPFEPADPLGDQYGLAAVEVAEAPPLPPPVAPVAPPMPPAATPPPAMPAAQRYPGFMAGLTSKMRTSLLVLLLVGFTGFSLYMAFRTAPGTPQVATTTPRVPFEPDTNRLFGRSRELASAPPAPAQTEQNTKPPAVGPGSTPPAPTSSFTGGADPRLIAQASPQETAPAGTRGIESDSRNLMRAMRGVDGTSEEYGIVGDLGDLAEAVASFYQTPAAEPRSLSNEVYAYPNGTARFHLIGGSFSSLDQANEAMAKARMLGLHPLILFPETPEERFRVSLLQSESRAALRDEHSRLKREGHFKGAWVLEQK